VYHMQTKVWCAKSIATKNTLCVICVWNFVYHNKTNFSVTCHNGENFEEVQHITHK
jgi:hypothetical protein